MENERLREFAGIPKRIDEASNGRNLVFKISDIAKRLKEFGATHGAKNVDRMIKEKTITQRQLDTTMEVLQRFEESLSSIL